MSVDSISGFAELLRHFRLLDPHQLDELTTQLQGRSPPPRTLAGELVRRGWLTPYQVNKLFNDRGDELLLGSYVLIERLGGGGMGEVYKARHGKLGKIVALKRIRAERLANAEVVRRFQREVRAVAQLNHPNVVHAYDCDEADGTHFLVMEYIEGIDLARYVKQHGPLPVPQACDCVRQAALGLQHAFERGLVHRDIKPHNLLIADASSLSPVVKILDMGLARLGPAEEGGELTSTVTAEGLFLGTVDYIAPEQARNAHTADTRADLYGLGCTLYFLLTGRVPFPGGTVAEKLLQHQLDHPIPVEQRRPETPPAVAAVLSKLMAKRPEDRYQTPAEAAMALAALNDSNTVVLSRTPTERLADGDATSMMDTNPGWSSIVTPPPLADSSSSSEQRRRLERRRRLWLGITGGVALTALVVLLLLLRRGENIPAPAPQTSAAHEPHPPAPTFEQWKAHVAELSASEQVKEVTAKLKKYNPGFEGTVKSTIEDGVVTKLEFTTDHVKDIRPVEALPKLRELDCRGSGPNAGRLSELSPLRGLPLARLVCSNNPIDDLSPLKEMPLKSLYCYHCRIADLSPLQGMSLTLLGCGQNPEIADLSPLKDMPLVSLACGGTRVSDLTPLKGMPLRVISCPLRRQQDREILRSIKTLQSINRQSAAQFWKDHPPTPSQRTDDSSQP